ncbi:hypothetical protein [Natrinema soli]|uniref:Phage head morphogenesis domain-containing protein n=1 Tax=Natrinema soli TaxID=1930624 RepID=A0ABD5SL31_9EURY|nr:hypothetical protein [Natrinema soli]
MFAAADDISPSDGFQFTTQAEAQDEFMGWLDEQTDRGILETIERERIRGGEHYTARYVRSAYSRGIDHADAQLNAEGVTVTDETLQQTFNRGIHAEQLQDLYTRSFDNLETVTTDMQTAVRRKLGTGLSQGWNPQKTARELNDRVDSIGITDAERLARTETLHSHNQSALNRYTEHGVQEVDILGHNPCDICKPIVNGGPYPIDEIPRGGPPFHPNCMGSVYPVVE